MRIWFCAFVLMSAAWGIIAGGQSRPTRMISLVPALTEMVFAIGAGSSVVAVSSFDRYPPEVTKLQNVGALLDPDVERILALKPDLVLLYGSQTDLKTQLTRAAIPYFEYRHGGLAEITGTIRALGARLGRSPDADSLASTIEKQLSALRNQTASLQKPRTLLVFERDRGSLRNIFASGGRGFLHDILETAGGINVFADVEAESVQASSELILSRAPQVIIELRSSGFATPSEQSAEMNSWRVLGTIPAVRDNRLYLLVDQAIGVPGPRVADSAAHLARVLHGITP
jgi:iron complex transport system substrate-binding protein